MYLIILSLFLCIEKAYLQCDYFQLNLCNELAKINKMDVTHLDELSFKLLNSNITEFNSLCKSANSTLNCVFTSAKCEEALPAVASITGGVKAVQYLCNYDRAGYTALVQCVAKNSSWFSVCTNSKVSDCRSYNALYNCLVNSAAMYCGSATTIKKYFEISYGTYIANTFNCYLENNQCDRQILSQCIDLAKKEHMDKDNINNLGSTMLGSNPNEFTRKCSVAEDIISCVYNQAYCADQLEKEPHLFSGVKAVQYYCKNDTDGFNKLKQCLVTDVSWFLACIRDTQITCRSINVFYRCIVNSVKKKCGNATTIKNYLYIAYQPILKYDSSCDLNVLGNKAAEINVQSIFLFFVQTYIIYYI